LRAVHPFEDGYGKNQTGTIPQQCLRYFMPEHPANAKIQELKRFICERFPEVLGDNESAKNSLSIVGKVDARVAYYAIRSGLEIVFKIAGHNIPNENIVRQQEGINTFIDPDTIASRLEEGKDLFRKFFGAESAGMLTDVSIDNALAEVAVHELGHNIGDKGVFKSNPGGVQAVEEWKATATSFVLQSLKDKDQLSDEYLRGTFLSFLCQTFRYAQRREERSQAPYFGADKIFTKVDQECGLVVKGEEGKWGLDLTREKLLAYADAIKNKWLGLQKIYPSADQGEMDKFIEENVVNTPFLEGVIAFVDKQ